MQEIKCPNCGSGLVAEITEEKYACLACDNVFLVHNLSKEFRQTDVHISDMHEDLKAAISNINVTANSWNTEMQATFENAFHLIEIGYYDVAFEKFTELCIKQSATYQSWWGKFLAMTMNRSSLDEDLICSPEVIECIANMRKCKDYSQELETELQKYLDIVFGENKAKLEKKLALLEQEVEQLEQAYKLKEEKEKLLEGKRGLFEQTKNQLKNRNTNKSIWGRLAEMAVIILAEWFVIKKLFIEWLGKSIDIVTSPLPDPSSPEAGSALGSAALNFIAIPFKFIIGVVVVIVVLVLVMGIIEFIIKLIKTDVETEMAGAHSEILDMELEQLELENKYNEKKRQVHEVKTHIALYDELDYMELSSFERYISAVESNYTDEKEYVIKITSVGDDEDAGINLIRDYTGISLSEAEEFVDNLPLNIKGTLDVLEAFQEELNEIGGESTILCIEENDNEQIEKQEEELKCEACGADIMPGAKFCEFCGAKV